MSKTTIKDWYDKNSSPSLKFVPSKNMIHRKILAYLHPKTGLLLDVACGTGDFLDFVSKSTSLTPYGIDISIAFKKANNNSKLQFVLSSGENLPFINKLFQYITIQGSLEHFPHPERGLKEIKAVATDDARICVLVPNRFYLFRYKDLWSKNGKDVPIELFLSLKGWKRMFKKCGFSIKAILQDNHPKFELDVFQDKNLMRFAWRVVKKLVWTVMPLPLTCQFIFILEGGSLK